MTKLTYKITEQNGKVVCEVPTFMAAEGYRLRGYKVTASYEPIEEEVKISEAQKARRIKI